MTETRKIRIGNDIRLAVDLRQYIRLPKNALRERDVYTPTNVNFETLDVNDVVNRDTEVYYNDIAGSDSVYTLKPTTGKPIAIRSVKAILVNTTRRDEYIQKLNKNSRFIARFPIEPDCDAFKATSCNICNSGYPTYKALPGRYYVFPYGGYGVYPNFSGLCKKLASNNDFKYIAEAYATEKQHIVEISFPAEHQRTLGNYSLIIVAKVYAPGYNSKNLKTITVDIPNVFELVETTEEGINTGINATATDVIDNLSYENEDVPDDVYVNSGDYSDNAIQLGRTDGQSVSIDLSEITGWYEGD